MKGDTVICPGCGKPFTQRRKDQRCCNAKCRYEAYAKMHPRIDLDRPLIEVINELAAATKNQD